MYVMFTSGSTGRPKGVLVEHRSALSLARAFIGRHAIGPADRVFGFFAPTFDPSVLDLLLALLSGATLRLWDQVGGGGGDWRASLSQSRATVVGLTPSAMSQLDPASALPTKKGTLGGPGRFWDGQWGEAMFMRSPDINAVDFCQHWHLGLLR